MTNNVSPISTNVKLSATAISATMLFILGLIIGCFTGYLTKSAIYSSLITFYNDIIMRIKNVSINNSDIFLLALKRNIKYVLFLYIFSTTNLWNIYYNSFIIYTGFSHGLLLSFNIIMYGPLGFIKYLCYQFPQAIIFIPLYIIVVSHCCNFHKDYLDHSDNTKKGKLLLTQFPFLLCNIIFVITGCLIEAWLNTPLVLWYSTVL